MAQHNCEDLKPIDTPSTFSTFTQASSNHISNPFVLITQWQPSTINPSDSPCFVEFRGLPPLILLLQCVNRLGLEICSVN